MFGLHWPQPMLVRQHLPPVVTPHRHSLTPTYNKGFCMTFLTHAYKPAKIKLWNMSLPAYIQSTDASCQHWLESLHTHFIHGLTSWPLQASPQSRTSTIWHHLPLPTQTCTYNSLPCHFSCFGYRCWCWPLGQCECVVGSKKRPNW